MSRPFPEPSDVVYFLAHASEGFAMHRAAWGDPNVGYGITKWLCKHYDDKDHTLLASVFTRLVTLTKHAYFGLADETALHYKSDLEFVTRKVFGANSTRSTITLFELGEWTTFDPSLQTNTAMSMFRNGVGLMDATVIVTSTGP